MVRETKEILIYFTNYQIADDEALSTNEIIRLIAEAQKRKSKIWNISRKLILLSARLGNVLHLPLYSERLQKLTESYVVSNHKLKNALGIENMPFTSIEGMKKTLASFDSSIRLCSWVLSPGFITSKW